MDKRVVLVTGANGGIGQAICKHFKKEDWFVIGLDITISDESSLLMDVYYIVDLTNTFEIQNTMLNIQKDYGRLDCIVNNAALQICKPIWEMSEYEWDRVMNCNVRAVFLLVKYGLELLKINKGNIINIGSVHSMASSDKIAAYACSKSAIVGLTRNLAIELGTFGIRVNCISPGAINTSMLMDGLKRNTDVPFEQVLERFKGKHVLGEIGEPEEIASMAYYICNCSKFMTGSNVFVDGGVLSRLSTE
jgi:NAD(P)-dependent dehydrogenase (short-subunit alcohol dehydrogenase family)